MCLDGVKERFLKSSLQGESESAHNTSLQSVVQVEDVSPSKRAAPKTGNQRFKEAREVCDELASLISATGGDQFRKRMQSIKLLQTIYLSGKEAVISPEVDAAEPQGSCQNKFWRANIQVLSTFLICHQSNIFQQKIRRDLILMTRLRVLQALKEDKKYVTPQVNTIAIIFVNFTPLFHQVLIFIFLLAGGDSNTCTVCKEQFWR